MKSAGNSAAKCIAAVVLGLASANLTAANLASGLEAFDRSDYQRAFADFRPLAEAGNARAECRLGTLYAMGRGVERDYGRALTWLRRSADQGYASAENDLGALYDQGRGVPEDPGEAARWFHKAAVQGHGSAQLNLASLYESGRGVRRDSVQAFAWANAASALGELRAGKVADSAGKNLTPGEIAPAEKLAARYRREYVRHFRRD